MLARVSSAAVLGIQAAPIDVEVDVAVGLSGCQIVGMPAAGVKEGRLRIRGTLETSGFKLPPRRIIGTLAPADLRTSGAAFDAPIPDGPGPAGRDARVTGSGPGAGSGPGLADVRGQEVARRALELAAAGGHNLLFGGPPGSGKTMLAQRLPGILPTPTFDEALETTMAYSVAGLLEGRALLAERPVRAPHHTRTPARPVRRRAARRPRDLTLAP